MTAFAALRSNRLLPALLTGLIVGSLFPARPARADNAPAPAPGGAGSAYNAALSVPETGTEVANGNRSPVSVNPSTGTASVSIPFEFPRARGRSQPMLDVSYSSAAGLGVGGYGWSENVPSVVRTPLSGPPTYADPVPNGTLDPKVEDRFSFEGSVLVPICHIPDTHCTTGSATPLYTSANESLPAFTNTGGWTYFRKETGADDVRLFWSGDHHTWVAQFKTGETLEMGHPLASDASGGYFGDAIDWDHDDTTKAFRWSLVRQYDSEIKNGVPVNRILYSWATIAGDLYLTDIFYTILAASAAQYPSPPSTFANHIRLAYDTSRWAPPVPTLVDPIWRSPPHLLLSHVDVTAASDVASATEASAASVSRRLVRRYWLNHTSDADYLYSGRTLLSSVQVEGRCAIAGTDGEGADFSVSPTTTCDRLPPTTYTYTTPVFHVAAGNFGSDQIGGPSTQGAFMYDVDTDGVPDIVYPKTPSGSLFATGATVDLIGHTQQGVPESNFIQVPFTYPAGFVQNGATFPATFAYAGTPTPGQSVPGNFAADGKLDMLVAGNYLPGLSGFQFGLLTPSTSGFTGMSAPILPLWQPTTVNFGGGGGGYITYAETPLAMVDIDGDGYVDTLTDTQVDWLNADWWEALSLRTTVANPDGTISPFARVTPNSVSFASGAAEFLPPAGQYYAFLNVEAETSSPPPFQDPDSRLFQFGVNYNGALPLSLFADMNGDGLIDWVTIDNAGSNLLYWVGHGDGTFGSCASGHNDCTGAARFQGANAGTSFPNMPAIPPGARVMLHDVTNDGFADLIVFTTFTQRNTTYQAGQLLLWRNEAGHGFDSGALIGLVGDNDPVLAQATEVAFGDIDGSGGDNVILLFGAVVSPNLDYSVRPGLLTGIANGYGASTSIQYASTTDLARQAVPAWTTSSPQILHHVTSVTSTNGMPAPFTESREVDYSYQNPVYDGRDRVFVGFEKVTTRTVGDANEPSMTTQTTFLSGTCFDGGSAACPTVAGVVDRPMLALRGLPVLEDTFDDAGHHVSTTHTAYTVRRPMTGVDGRGVRFAYPSTVDTFLYDSSAVLTPSASPVSLGEVTYTDDVTQGGQSRLVTLAAPAGNVVQTETRRLEDINGNTTSTTDAGVIAGAGKAVPHGGSYDSPIAVTTTWLLPVGDPTQFQWRPTGMARAAFPMPAGVTAPADVAASAGFTYGPDGLPSLVTSTAAGEASLVRASGGAPSPSTAIGDGAMVGISDFYDAFGNLTAEVSSSGATCTATEYDAPFAQFATSQSSYRDGCSLKGVPASTAAIVTSQAWDRGFGRPTLKIAANASTSTYTYDGFGRLATMSLPDPTTGAPSTPPTVTMHYYGSVQNPLLDTGYPVIQTSVGIFNGASGTQLSWSYADAWGQPLARLVPADTLAGDSATWIVRDQTLRSARGATIAAYTPYFWMNGSDASRFPFNALPSVTVSGSSVSVGATPAISRTVPIAAASASYDAFGRVVRTVGLDGATATAAYSYHALEEDVQDAEQQLGGSHGGASSYQIWDGHNRAVRAGQLFYDPVAKSFDERVQSTIYTSGGLPWILRQTHSADATVVQRTMQYDSLGRLVANLEPNTSTSGSGFRYVYDADGRLVGTSDDNGCGENIAYDGIGRRVWEDYSPCTSAQRAYTAAPTSWSNKNVASTTGVETFFAYDHSPTLLDNQLSAEYSRGEASFFTYDARNRVTNVSRVLGAPTWSSVGTLDASGNYGAHLFNRTMQYDAVNRVLGESTGADVPELLGTDVLGNGQTKSFVTATYSQRGVVSSVQGSYGTLLRSNVIDADGAPLTRVYGDPAGTTQFQCYDGLRHVSEVGVYRNASHPACAHYAFNPPTATVATSQTTLIDDVYTRDKVGNPLAIADNRKPAEWAPGSMPVNRAMTPDDAYRVNKVTYAYATSTQTDSFVSPLLAKTSVSQPMEPIASADTRVTEQDYSYDWLGNTTRTNDDQNVFFERSLQQVNNGTATNGPNRVNSAGTPITFLDGTLRGEKANVSYDNAGNVTGISAFIGDETCTGHCTLSFAFEWDELGRLMDAQRFDDGAATAAADVHYVYDGSGRRVLRAALEGAETLYSAQVFPSLRLDGAQWESTDYQRDATTESAYLVLRGETFGRVLYTAPENVTPAVPSQHVFLMMGDSLGSTTAVIDNATSMLVERMTYYPFGGVESEYRSPSWGNFSESYKYTGKEDDAEVGVTYFGARFYSRFLGRWLSPDPLAIHAAAGDPNPYAFVHGAPFRFVDPTGLDGCDNLSPGCGNGTPIPVSGDAQAAGNAAGWLAKEAKAAEQWASKAVKTFECWFSHCGPSAPPPPPPSVAVPSYTNPFPSPWWNRIDPSGISYATWQNFKIANDPNHSGLDRFLAGGLSVGAILPFVDMEEGVALSLETAAEAARGPAATLELAMQVQGNVPLGAQTITLLETAEGPTLVAGGETDLSAAQTARAQELGLTPADPLPGFHAEQTALVHASENGLTPTSGVTTNGVCAGRCTPLIVEELGGWVDGNTYGFGPR